MPTAAPVHTSASNATVTAALIPVVFFVVPESVHWLEGHLRDY